GFDLSPARRFRHHDQCFFQSLLHYLPPETERRRDGETERRWDSTSLSLCLSIPLSLHLSVSVLSALNPLGLIPVLVHLLHRNFRPGSSLFGDPFFDVSEAAAEFTARGFERAFRLHAAPAGQIGDDEEDVADLAGDGFVRDSFTG